MYGTITAPALQVAVSQITANPDWNLQKAMNFVDMYIHVNKLKFATFNTGCGINALGTGCGKSGKGGRGRGRGVRGGRGSRGTTQGGEKPGPGEKGFLVEDRYYKKEEFQKFTEEQKAQHRQLKAESGRLVHRQVNAVSGNHVTFELVPTSDTPTPGPIQTPTIAVAQTTQPPPTTPTV